MRNSKPKLFLLTGRFDISIVIQAEDKEEALAFSKEEFPSLVSVDTSGLVGVQLTSKTVLKLKSPKRFKVS